jgi:hypothetical protein
MEGKRGRSPSSTPSTSQNKFRRHSHETPSSAAPSDEVRIIYGNATDRDKRAGGGQKRESPLSSARQPLNRRDRSPSCRPAKSQTRQGLAGSESRHSQAAAAGSSGRGQRNESQPAVTTFNSPLTSRPCSDDVMSGSVEELRRYIRSMEQERKVLEADVEAGRLKALCHK